MKRQRSSWSSWLPVITRNSLAFGAASFSSSVLCTLFALYSTPVFTSVYQISDGHFYASHVVFAVWNAINDPAFAWLIDNTTASGAERRLPAIKYGGPLWCLSFLIPWWPWSNEPGSWLVGAHFCFSICMFDSFLTYVLLVHCALLADLTTDNTLRNNYNNVGSLLGVAGGAAGAASYHLYDEKNMAPFRLFCLCAAGLSCIGFWYTGTRLNLDRLEGFRSEETSTHGLHTQDTYPVRGGSGASPKGNGMRARSPGSGNITADNVDEARKSLLSKASSKGATGGSERGGRELSFWEFSKQLSSHGNFWLYVSMNFVENFHNLFDQSFFVFLDTKLLRQSLPAGAHGVLTALCLYLPKKVGISLDASGRDDPLPAVDLTILALQDAKLDTPYTVST